MPRDYKHRANSSRKRATLSPLVGALAGLLIGLFVAFLVYIKSQSEPREQEYVQEMLPPPATTASEDAAVEAHSEEATSSPPPPKPRFDFYTLLPEMEVVIPEEEITESLKQSPPPPATTPAPPATSVSKTEPEPQVAPVPAVTPKPAATAKPAAPATATGTYYLQVGSFSDGVKAERFKAELGMMGMQTSIQKVTINNRETYHRVRVGPFGTLDELDRTRQTLKKKGIDSTPIKVRG